jgi:hypothetical protein
MPLSPELFSLFQYWQTTRSVAIAAARKAVEDLSERNLTNLATTLKVEEMAKKAFEDKAKEAVQ